MLISKMVFGAERNSINICRIEQAIHGVHGQDPLKQNMTVHDKKGVLGILKNHRSKILLYEALI